MKPDLSILNSLEIASPCSASWDDMEGDDRQRFCAACKLNVYNISGMSRAAAEELLLTSEGHLCVRLFRRADGTVLTRDCPVGLRAVRRALVRSGLLAAAMVAFVLLCGLRALTFGKTAGQGPIADLIDRIHPRAVRAVPPALRMGQIEIAKQMMGRICPPGLKTNTTVPNPTATNE